MSYRGITISLKNPYQGFLILFAQYIPKNSPTFKNQSDEKVLAALKTYCLYKNICYPSIQRIVEKTGLSKRTVDRALQRLKKEEIIKTRYRRRKKNGQNSSSSNLYILNLKKILPYGFKITYDILSDVEKVFAYRFLWLILRKLRYLVKYKIRLCKPYQSSTPKRFVSISGPSTGLLGQVGTPNLMVRGSSYFSSNLSFPFFKFAVSPTQQPSRISYSKKGSPPLSHPEQDLSYFNLNKNKEVPGYSREASVSVSLGKLRQIGVKDINKGTMKRLISQYGGDRIQKSIEMTEWWSHNRESDHLEGYFIQSIRNNYKTKEMQMVEAQEDREKEFNEGIEDRRKKRLEWEKEKISAAGIQKVIDEMRPFERERLRTEARIKFLQQKGPKPEDLVGKQLYKIEERCFMKSFMVKKIKQRELKE